MLIVWLVTIVAGLAAGFVSGLMGVGGGIILTPVLHYGLGYAWSDAVAISLFVIALQAPIGLWRHHRRGAVAWRGAGPLVLGGAIGVAAGVWLEPRLPVAALKAVFATLLAVAAWRLTRPATKSTTGPAAVPAAPPGAAPATSQTGAGTATPLAAGIIAGTASRLLGIGGGIVTVPALALAGTPAHVAVGTSLVAVWTNGVVATIGNLGRDLPWLLGIGLAGAALAGSVVGAETAHRLPERGLRRVVAIGLVTVGALLAADAVGWQPL